MAFYVVMARERAKMAANVIPQGGLIAPIPFIGLWERATSFNRCVVIHGSGELIAALPRISVPVRIHLRSVNPIRVDECLRTAQERVTGQLSEVKVIRRT